MDANAPPNPDDGGRGRPPKCTPELTARVVTALLTGNYRNDAARLVGIRYSTLKRWLKNGAEYPDGIYGHFRASVLAAESSFKTTAVARIVSAGSQDDPRLLLEFLSRKYPKQFGQYRGEMGALKKLIKDQAVQISELEREVEELIRESGGQVSS